MTGYQILNKKELKVNQSLTTLCKPCTRFFLEFYGRDYHLFANFADMKTMRDKIGSIVGYIKRIFSTKKQPSSVHTDEDGVQTVYGEQTWKSPFYTFYPIGPGYFTYKYPVDPSCIEKEILDENGLIGPAYYNRYPDVMEHLADYDNEWLNREAPKGIFEHLIEDLRILAEEHNCIAAYTILSSLMDKHELKMKYMRKAAEGGSPAGMVAYGQFMCTDHHIEEGFQWIKKGAKAGHDMGMCMVGLSYQFGTFTPIDYKEAAKWYKLALAKEGEMYYCAANNLGSLYVEAGCLHTAKEYFQKANKNAAKEETKKEIVDFGCTRTLNNLKTCMEILEFPSNERKKRIVVQTYAPELNPVFCNYPITGDFKAPATIHSKDTDRNPALWKPVEEELAEDDIKERRTDSSLALYQQPQVKYPFDNFVFPYYEVEIRHPEILGFQHELVFLEKYAHAELNQYIQEHIWQLRAIFKQCGYYLTYLPAHVVDLLDEHDRFGCFVKEHGYDNARPMFTKQPDENMYWSTLFTEEELPDDCAGFLQLVPKPDNVGDMRHYKYILFPHRPGTDWKRAFTDFIRYMSTQPFVEMHGTKKKLESGFLLLIDRDYHIFITDANGQQLVEIKMPALSKVLYFLLLKYPAGISIKELVDYRDELMLYYSSTSTKATNEQSIYDLVDPTKNSANEKLSRIRNAFENALESYQCDTNMFTPIGKKGEKYKVTLDRSCIRWEPTEFSIFNFENQ